MTSRSQLRTRLRQERKSLSLSQQDTASLNLLQQLRQNPSSPLNHLKPDCKVALYLANDGEISPHIISQWLWQNNVKTYLPCIDGETLVFAHYHKGCQWQHNQFNIAEPLDPAPLSGQEMDLVFMPLVGFDLSGGRLGMGGGFYDKTFANRSSFLVGLAHDCQQVEQLPIESWDVPLDAIATDTLYVQANTL
jgi:5-formyltetrahydrofolate cyclo-ligase